MRTLIKNVLAFSEPKENLTVKGWVRTRRDAKGFSFLELNDGSCLANLQAVVDASLEGYDHKWGNYDAHNPEKPLRLEIPYERIRSVRRGRVSVVVDVARGRPKGFIYFEPAANPQALVKALNERREHA